MSIYSLVVRMRSLSFLSTTKMFKITGNITKENYFSKCFLSTTNFLLNEVLKKEKMLLITDACVQQLKKVAAPGEFLRVSVEGGGCSGFSYKFALDSELQSDDVCFDQEGARIVSDEASLDLIKGSTVDYEEELIKSAFCVKNNPQSSMKCSCGISFGID